MLAFSHDLVDYFYDVFVVRFDFWLAFGIVAQLLFTARFIVQWLASERAGKSVIPFAFGVFSIVGGGLTLVYGVKKREPQPQRIAQRDALGHRLGERDGLCVRDGDDGRFVPVRRQLGRLLPRLHRRVDVGAGARALRVAPAARRLVAGLDRRRDDGGERALEWQLRRCAVGKL
jgi:lipid-A-disaccharide synthase-like uncharacterized protein